MGSPANIRISAQFPFPALAVGASPITLTKLNGVYTIGFNIAGLAIQTPPAGNYPTDYLIVYDSIAKTFFQMPLSFLGVTQLNAATTFYVDTNLGNDNGSGLSPGAGAFKTLQGALTKISSSYNLNGQAVTIQMGTVGGPVQAFNENAVVPQFIDPGQFTIQGDVANPANVTINNLAPGNTLTVGSLGGAQVSLNIKGVAISAGNAGGLNCIAVNDSCRLVIAGNMTFGAAGAQHMQALRGGGIIIKSGYNVSGGAVAHINLSQSAVLLNNGANQVTVTGNIAVTNWINLTKCSTCAVSGMSFSLGAFAVTGTRFSSNANSVIDTNGGGANFFPGTIAGALAQTGAQYI